MKLTTEKQEQFIAYTVTHTLYYFFLATFKQTSNVPTATTKVTKVSRDTWCHKWLEFGYDNKYMTFTNSQCFQIRSRLTCWQSSSNVSCLLGLGS